MSTVITKPTFSVDGWTGNTIDDQGVDWFNNVMTGWFTPVGVRNSGTDRPTGDGIYSDRNYRTVRVITLGGLATAPDLQSAILAMDRFNALLSDGELHELVVDEPYRTLSAMVKLGSNPNLDPVNPRQFDYQLILIAPDPRKYGAYQQDVTGIATDALGGVLWNGPAGSTGTPWNGPAGVTGVVWQSGSGTTGTVTLTNLGTAHASIQFTITDAVEAVVTPSIVDTSTGRTIAYGETISAGTSLAIDTGAGSVLLDGANRGPLLTRDEWFSIPPLSTIEVLFSSPSPAPNAQLLARWRDAYL